MSVSLRLASSQSEFQVNESYMVSSHVEGRKGREDGREGGGKEE